MLQPRAMVTGALLLWAAVASVGAAQVGVPDGAVPDPTSPPASLDNATSPPDLDAAVGSALQGAGVPFGEPGADGGSNGGSGSPPEVVTGLRAAAGNAVVTLTWTAPASNGSPITGYEVFRGTSSGGEVAYRALGTVLNFQDASVLNGRTYYYKVSATNAAGEGGRSIEVSATPAAPGHGGSSGAPSSGSSTAPRGSATTDPFANGGPRNAAGASTSTGSSASGGTNAARGDDASPAGQDATLGAATSGMPFAPEVPVLVYVLALALLVLGARWWAGRNGEGQAPK